jgi:hypothetical protein
MDDKRVVDMLKLNFLNPDEVVFDGVVEDTGLAAGGESQPQYMHRLEL